MSNVITGARGNLEGYGKIKICPACLDITDEQFVLTLPHILQVRMSLIVSECLRVSLQCLRVSPSVSKCPECLGSVIEFS